jgi:hypothetical protein
MILSPKNKEQYEIPFKRRKHLNFDAMVNRISASIKMAYVPTSGKAYHQHDIVMGALACMFFSISFSTRVSTPVKRPPTTK